MFLPGCVDEGDDPSMDGGTPVIADLPCFEEPTQPGVCCEEDPNNPGQCIGTTPLPPIDTTWLSDTVSGTYYRLATGVELDVNDWPTGTTLLVNPVLVDALTNGSTATQKLAIPLPNATGSLSIIRQDVELKRSQHDVVFAQQFAAGAPRTIPVRDAFRPEFYTFLPTWVNLARLRKPRGLSEFARVYADSYGGVNIRGLTSEYAFDAAGPTTELFLESLPPVGGGVLVMTVQDEDQPFDDVADITIEAAAEICSGGQCVWELDPNETVFNCGDCTDNDLDSDIDTGDIACKHRKDLGCQEPATPPHNHGWENSKNFALLPDTVWCTLQMADGMPWHTMLFAYGADTALLLNILRGTAQTARDENDQPYTVNEAEIPAVRHVFSYCVQETSFADALDCRNDAIDCPDGYELGGTGGSVQSTDATTKLFRPLWNQLDVAAQVADGEGLTAQPVAMVAGIYQATNIVGGTGEPIGIAAGIGDTWWSTAPDALGASAIEADPFMTITLNRLAHEIGHTLGLSHTEHDPHFGAFGFMSWFQTSNDEETFPLAILGPYRVELGGDPTDPYGFVDEWEAYLWTSPKKYIPRGNAFDYVGCASDSDCPSPYTCKNQPGGTGSLCRP